MLNVGVIASSEIKTNIAQVAGNNYVGPTTSYVPPATVASVPASVTATETGIGTIVAIPNAVAGVGYNVQYTAPDGTVSSYTTYTGSINIGYVIPTSTNLTIQTLAPINGIPTYSAVVPVIPTPLYGNTYFSP